MRGSLQFHTRTRNWFLIPVVCFCGLPASVTTFIPPCRLTLAAPAARRWAGFTCSTLNIKSGGERARNLAVAGGGHIPTSARCSHATAESPSHQRPRRDFAEALVSALAHGPELTEKLFPGAVEAHLPPPNADACAGAALQAITLHAAQVLRGGGGGEGAAHDAPNGDQQRGIEEGGMGSGSASDELLMPPWLLGEKITVPGVGEGGLCKLCGSETAHVAACEGLEAFLVNLFHDVASGTLALL